jgi:hypothetical protein
MISIKPKNNLTEAKRPKNWLAYIWDHLDSDTASDILYDIFASPNPRALLGGAILKDAVAALKTKLPSVPDKELALYIRIWVEHHESLLKYNYRRGISMAL